MGGRPFTGKGTGVGVGIGCGFGVGWGFGGGPIGFLGMGAGGGCGVGVGLGWGIGIGFGAEYLDTSPNVGFDSKGHEQQSVGEQLKRGLGTILTRAKLSSEYDPTHAVSSKIHPPVSSPTSKE